jgi:ParB/RepB/Spo0J family partition protein
MSDTPLIVQYKAIKVKYPDAVLLFRVGDFYEIFGEDAVIASKVLGIVLTKRSNPDADEKFIQLAGFPYHSLETYLPKLVKNGHRVAICDQLENPKDGKQLLHDAGMLATESSDAAIASVQKPKPITIPTTMNAQLIAIASIIVPKEQTRSNQDQSSIQEMADSIQDVGLLQPITVTPNTKKKDTYHILAGRRRLAAHKLLGLTSIAVVIKTDLTPEQKLDIEIAENLQRKDISVLDEAAIVGKLMEQHGNDSVVAVASRLNKNINWTITRKDIHALPVEIKAAYATGKISKKVLLQLATSTPDTIDSVIKSLSNGSLKETTLAVNPELINCGFDIKDETLHPNGSCVGCRYNSNNQELFDSGVAQCLLRSCFVEKQKAAQNKVIGQIIADGGYLLLPNWVTHSLDEQWKGHERVLDISCTQYIPIDQFEDADEEESNPEYNYYPCYDQKFQLVAMYSPELQAEVMKGVPSGKPQAETQATEAVSSDPVIQLKKSIAEQENKLAQFITKSDHRKHEFLIESSKGFIAVEAIDDYIKELPDSPITMLLLGSLTASKHLMVKDESLECTGLRNHLRVSMNSIAYKSNALEQYAIARFPAQFETWKAEEVERIAKRKESVQVKIAALQKSIAELEKK